MHHLEVGEATIALLERRRQGDEVSLGRGKSLFEQRALVLAPRQPASMFGRLGRRLCELSVAAFELGPNAASRCRLGAPCCVQFGEDGAVLLTTCFGCGEVYPLRFERGLRFGDRAVALGDLPEEPIEVAPVRRFELGDVALALGEPRSRTREVRLNGSEAGGQLAGPPFAFGEAVAQRGATVLSFLEAMGEVHGRPFAFAETVRELASPLLGLREPASVLTCLRRLLHEGGVAMPELEAEASRLLGLGLASRLTRGHLRNEGVDLLALAAPGEAELGEPPLPLGHRRLGGIDFRGPPVELCAPLSKLLAPIVQVRGRTG